MPLLRIDMDYGFVIDNRRCIGCHACTVACKAEHEVPLGNFRTWVKSVEKGIFPNVRRYFAVLRCNHCSDAPCVNICPTRALFHRSNGTVDFDSEQCIGCKACMAACPYDALYIDPQSNTAAKCNYCQHRLELGLEPPCVTVCPEHAIIAGDMSDPHSRISGLIALQQVSVRKPHIGTRPKLFYVEADSTALTPGAAAKTSGYAWAQRLPEETAGDFHWMSQTELARVSYDVSHETPWGKPVALYLWTKSLATGPMLVAALLGLLRYVRAPALFGLYTPILALVMIGVTLLLLTGDLRQPRRFLRLIFHPNRRSWLVWGSYVLMVFSGIASLWLVAGILHWERLFMLLLWPGLVSASLAAGYSAFLLAQARGRDLWRSRLLFPHLLVQAFLAGSAALVLCALIFDSGGPLRDFLLQWLLGAVCLHGLLLLGEVARTRGNEAASAAAQYMLRGPLARLFWLGAVLVGIALPIYLLAFFFMGGASALSLAVGAAALSLLGLLVYEDCYVRAGQALPLS